MRRIERTIMAHLANKQFVERANSAVLLAILGGGLAACVIGATVYDILQLLQH